MTSTRADFGIGIESNAVWFSVGDYLSTNSFKWYGKTTNVMTLGGTGNLSCVGAITCPSLTVGTTTEVSQIHCGPTVGLNLQTKTAHPIRFSTYTNAATQFISVVPSMQILANSSRDVEILSPLKCTSPLSTCEWAVNIGTSSLLTENALLVDAGARIEGALTVIGNLTVEGFSAVKPWVAIYTNGAGTVSTSIKPGYITPTLSRTAMGTYVYTLPTPHPSGSLYEVFVQQRKALATTALAHYGVSILSSTQFTVWSTTYLNALVDSDFYLHTVP